jgi:hypothetical protein
MHPHAQDLNSARYLSDGPEAAHRDDVPVHLGDNEDTARCRECLPWIGQVIERRGRQRFSWRQGKGNREVGGFTDIRQRARRPQARQLRVDRPTWSRDVLLALAGVPESP